MARGLQRLWPVWARSSCIHRRRCRERRSWRSIARSARRGQTLSSYTGTWARTAARHYGVACLPSGADSWQPCIALCARWHLQCARCSDGPSERRERAASASIGSLCSSTLCTGAYMACRASAGACVVGWRSMGRHAVEHDTTITMCDCVGPCAGMIEGVNRAPQCVHSSAGRHGHEPSGSGRGLRVE